MERIARALIAAAVVCGCGDDDDDDVVVQPQHTLAADVQGNPGFEELSGDSVVTWTEGQNEFVATMTLNGDEPGEERPWHVHFNSCETGGGIVGTQEYPLLEIDDQGSATATATILFELDPNTPYHINVHESADDLATLIACGDLVPTSAGAGGTGGTAGTGGTGGTGGTAGSAGTAGSTTGGTGGTGGTGVVSGGTVGY